MFRKTLTLSAVWLAIAAAGVNAGCPAFVTVNGATFDPAHLKASLWGQQHIENGNVGATFDFEVKLCATAPECGGDVDRQGSYYITQMVPGRYPICTEGLFGTMTSDLGVSGNSLTASYSDKTGLRVANVQVSCGRNITYETLSPVNNSFTTTLDPATSVTTYTFNYHSYLLCPQLPPVAPSVSAPSKPVSLLKLKRSHDHAKQRVRGDAAKPIEGPGSDHN